jgi:hypothetical protein
MISINFIGVGAVSAKLRARINSIGGDAIGKDKLLRGAASTLLGNMKHRIHQEGKDSDGNQIGTYTPSYLKRRQGKPFNRTADPNVILSLTGKMENNFIIGATANGYGLGFTNEKDFQKSQWCEETYGKPIYKPTVQEVTDVQKNVEDFVNENLR